MENKINSLITPARIVLIGILSALFFIIASPIIQTTCSGDMNLHTGTMGAMCHTQQVSSAYHNDGGVFGITLPIRLSIDFVFVVAVLGFLFLRHRIVKLRLPHNILYRDKYLRWIWARALPFLSLKNYIPYFFPVRGA